MSVYTLNIGLKPSDESNRVTLITREEVLAAVRAAGYRVLAFHVANSATEPTAVVVVHGSGLWTATSCLPIRWAAYNIAEALDQDCIAVLSADTGQGHLFGPNSAKWGEFNRDYFITEEQAEEAQVQHIKPLAA